MDLAVNYDSFAFNKLISPRPLLLIVGSKADTYYHSQVAYDQAKELTELFEVEGKTHVSLYDDTTGSMPKLVDFCEESSCVSEVVYCPLTQTITCAG